MSRGTKSEDTMHKYPSKYNKIGYSVSTIVPKEVAEHLNLEGKGKVVWIVDERINDKAVLMKG